MRLKTPFGHIVAILLWPCAINAQTALFSEDFESDLSQWTGQDGGAYSAEIVVDPLDPSNHVVTFRERATYGDIFGTEFPVIQGMMYVMYLDYLGVPGGEGSDPDNLGGFAGYAEDTATPIWGYWLAGTFQFPDYPDVQLIDDGTWHSYAIVFNPYAVITPANNTIRVMLEDWDGGIGIPGDAFFDNIRVELTGPVPVETATWGRIKAMYDAE